MNYESLEILLHQEQAKFRDEVFTYLSETGRREVGRTYFGVKAANNPALVSRLESGGVVRLETIRKVRRFMKENPPKKAPA